MVDKKRTIPSSGDWLKAREYCKRTGESLHAIRKRRNRGQWIDGVHCKLDPAGHLWINYQEAQSWVTNGKSRRVSRSVSTQAEKPSASDSAITESSAEN